MNGSFVRFIMIFLLATAVSACIKAPPRQIDPPTDTGVDDPTFVDEPDPTDSMVPPRDIPEVVSAPTPAFEVEVKPRPGEWNLEVTDVRLLPFQEVDPNLSVQFSMPGDSEFRFLSGWGIEKRLLVLALGEANTNILLKVRLASNGWTSDVIDLNVDLGQVSPFEVTIFLPQLHGNVTGVAMTFSISKPAERNISAQEQRRLDTLWLHAVNPVGTDPKMKAFFRWLHER